MTAVTERLIEYTKQSKETLRVHGIPMTILGGIAIAGYIMQQDLEITRGFDEPWRAISESMSHPMLGYVGALAGAAIMRGRRARDVLTGVIFGASFANFGTEALQDAYHGNQILENGFLSESQHLESVKDYVFALGGMGLAMLQNKFTPYHYRKTDNSRSPEN